MASITDDILGIDAWLNLDALDAGLRRLLLAGINLGPVFRGSRRDMRNDQRDHARGEEAPDGRWAQLSPWTVAKRNARKNAQGRRRRAHKIGPVRVKGRRILGRLPGAIDVTADNRHILARSRVSWSGAHQRGATVGRGSRLPARPFLWASSRLLRAIARRIGGHLEQAWKGV